MAYSERKLLLLLPKILRARDFHLYTENGKRLTDLWLQGGRAILGHKPPRFLVELKNAAERGLFSPLPHPMERRIIKALSEFFPGRAFRLFLNEGSMLRALEEAGYKGPFHDPAFPSNNSEQRRVSLWRPFATFEKKVTDTILIPVLPWPLGPEALVLEKSLDASFPAGEIIPPVLLAPAARALHNLAASLKEPGQGRQRYRKIEKVLAEQKSGTSLSHAQWQRQGIYLTATGDISEKYEEMFQRFLEGGFLIPPSPDEPIILPASMSDGEESKLAELLGDKL